MPEDINEEGGGVAVADTVAGATIAVRMSFAVALTAGNAALWLAHPEREALFTRSGKVNLGDFFAHAMRRSSRRSTGWDSNRSGPGLVNAEALLAAALSAAAPPLASAVELNAAETLTAAERSAPYLPDRSTPTAAAALDTVVGDAPNATCMPVRWRIA